MITYLFEVPGTPVAKQRPRTTRTGHTYTPQQTVMYENLVKTCFMQKYPCHTPTEQPVSVSILAVYPIPKSWSKKDKIKAINHESFPRKNDWDNIAKAVCDSLNGVFYHDDAQIFDGQVFKRYGDRPRVVVMLTTFDEDDLKGGTAEVCLESTQSPLWED